MTRDEIIKHVTEIINTVDGVAYYESTSPPGSRTYLPDYQVALDEETVREAAVAIADWLLTRGVSEWRTTI